MDMEHIKPSTMSNFCAILYSPPHLCHLLTGTSGKDTITEPHLAQHAHQNGHINRFVLLKRDFHCPLHNWAGNNIHVHSIKGCKGVGVQLH